MILFSTAGELRLADLSNIESKDESKRTIGGYAVVWNAEADLGTFVESFSPGAFTRYLSGEHDIIALFNHDSNNILARESAGNLRVKEDSKGLYYEIDLPDTSTARDLYNLVEKKIVRGASFHFALPVDESGQTIEKMASGKFRRTVTDAAVYEVGPVTNPAYKASTVFNRASPELETQLRSLEAQSIAQPCEIDNETAKRYVDFLKLKEGLRKK